MSIEFQYSIPSAIRQRISRFNNRQIFYGLWIIILCNFIFVSCSSIIVGVRPDLMKSKHNVLVIPYKSAPIQIIAYVPQSIKTFVGYDAERAVDVNTKKERSIKVSSLNKALEGWNPVTITANECISILNKRSKVPIESITIANIRELPSADKLRLKEPKIFISDSRRFTDFAYLMTKWVQAKSPTINYKQEYPDNKADWVLELSNSFFFVSDYTIELSIILKIFDINSGELLANYYAYKTMEMSPITDMSDLNLFKREFNDAIKSLCKQALVTTGIVSNE